MFNGKNFFILIKNKKEQKIKMLVAKNNHLTISFKFKLCYIYNIYL